MKIRRRIPTIIICLCMLITLLHPRASFADSGGGLVLHYGYSNARFYLYQVADQNKQLTGSFAGYDISLDCENNAEWQALALRLEKIVEEKGLTPWAKQQTGERGDAVFDHLAEGWYLVTGDSVRINGITYQPVAFVVNVTDGIQTKADVKHSPVPEEPTEPEEPTSPEEPISPEPEEPTNPEEPTSPEEPEKPERPGGSHDHGGGGDSGGDEVTESSKPEITTIVDQNVPGGGQKTPETAEIPEQEVPLARLPQTGQLWWPVPLFLGGGCLLILAAVVCRKRGSSRHEQ